MNPLPFSSSNFLPSCQPILHLGLQPADSIRAETHGLWKLVATNKRVESRFAQTDASKHLGTAKYLRARRHRLSSAITRRDSSNVDACVLIRLRQHSLPSFLSRTLRTKLLNCFRRYPLFLFYLVQGRVDAGRHAVGHQANASEPLTKGALADI